jgi:hypothetical protein
MYFSLFLDESGKIHSQEYTALCGYVATVDEWFRFGQAWSQLQIKWNLPPLKMSKIEHPDGEWGRVRKRVEAGGDTWETWKDMVLNEFCTLVANSSIAAVGSVIDAAAYRAVKDEDPQDFLIHHSDCNVYLLQYAIMAALDIVERVDKSGLMSVCIDDDQETAFPYYESYWTLQKMTHFPNIPPEHKSRFDRIAQRVDQIAFCKDTFHPALQAADLLAYVSRRLKFENPGPGRLNDLYVFFTRGGTYPVKDFREKDIRKIAENTARSLREKKYDDKV